MIPNIDTLVLNFDITNYDLAIVKFIKELEEAKDLARTYLYENSNDISNVILGNIQFQVLPNGARSYAYLLQNDRLRVSLAKGRSKSPTTFPVVVTYTSALLWEKGLNAYFYAYDWLVNTFGEVKTTMVSRADFCLHTDKIALNIMDLDRFVGKFRKDSLHRLDRKVETVYLGSGSTQTVMCRIYNKSREVLEKRNKLWFFDIWLANDLDITKVWNVEFELHRKFFREIEISTFDDLIDNIKGIWDYLTKEWLRYVDETTATRLERCNSKEEWKLIQQGFQEFDMDGHIHRSVQILRDVNKYIPGAVGYLTSLSAMLNITDENEAMSYLYDEMKRYLEDKKMVDFKGAVEDKRKAFDIEAIKAKLRETDIS